MNEQECVFCKIIRSEEESSVVFEDELSIAFMDIHPINEGHLLVGPKIHVQRFTQLDPTLAGHLFKVANKILRAIEKSDIRCEGANLFLSDGVVAGQEVMHTHLHIAPRFKGDGQRVGLSYADSEAVSRKALNETARKILKHISD